MKVVCIRRALLAVLFTLTVVQASSAQSWKFGVISDTQWGVADDGKKPGSCSVDIIKAINQQFIENKVKFVIAVGDLVDKIGDKKTGIAVESVANAEDIRAALSPTPKIFVLPLPRNSITLELASFRSVATTTRTGSPEPSSRVSIRRRRRVR